MCALAGALDGCKSPVDHRAALVANEWQLKEMTNEKGEVSLPTRLPTLSFVDSSRVSGFSGCNRFSGKYELKGENITFGHVVATRMMCLESMEFEQQFQLFLSAVTRLSLHDNELVLHEEKGETRAVFVPAPPRE